jgi:hypothetical protein
MATKQAQMRKSKPSAAPPRVPKPKPKPQPVKVVALRDGYYDNQRRREGDVFLVNEDDLATETGRATTWFEPVSPDEDLRLTRPNEAIARENRGRSLTDRDAI